jgi:hypothetical protein
LSDDEVKLLERVERLPNKIILDDKCFVLDGDELRFTDKIDYSKALQAYEVTIGQKSIDGILPLYQLALIRRPHLIIKRKDASEIEEEKQEDGDDMPYEVVEGHEECEELFAVVKIDGQEVMGCQL